MSIVWLRPREALAAVQTKFGISHEQAVTAICRRASRLSPQMIVAIASCMIGESPASVPRMPANTDVNPIWPFFWQSDFARDPENILWSTGDSEFWWTGIEGDTFTMLDIRFSSEGIGQFLDENGGANDNPHSSVAEAWQPSIVGATDQRDASPSQITFAALPDPAVDETSDTRGRRPKLHGAPLANFLSRIAREGIESAAGEKDETLGAWLQDEYRAASQPPPNLRNASRDARSALEAWRGSKS